MWTFKVKVVTRCMFLLFNNNRTVKWSSPNSSHVTPLLLGIWPTHVKEVSKKVSWIQKTIVWKYDSKVLILSFYLDGVDGCWLPLPYSFAPKKDGIHPHCVQQQCPSFLREKLRTVGQSYSETAFQIYIWFAGIVGDICDIFEDKGSFAVSKCLQA